MSIIQLKASTDDFRIMWNGDPSTSMVIGWNQVDGNNATVYYDVVDHGMNVAAYAFSNGVDKNVSAFGMDNNFSRLTGLSPNTIYYFVIEDSNSVSERMWFKTMPNVQTEKLSFLAGGDSRNNRVQRQNANKLVAALRPHAVLFGGDYTSTGTNTQWQDWFEDWQLTIGTDGRIIPIVATRGNHESNNSHMVDLFDVPSSDVYYKTDFAGGLISAYTLNTEITIGGTQAAWLDTELSNDNSIYKIAQYHKPVRSHNSNKSEGVNQYNHWVPLFDQYGMDLVVECDSHTAKSTWPIVASSAAGNDEGFVRDDANGTVYVGEGCWGAPLRVADDAKSWTRDSGMFNQIKWIFVDLIQIEVRSIKTDNACTVGTVDDSDIFTPPANLDINNPANGDVIIIPNPQIVCSALNLADYEQCDSGTLSGVPNNLSGMCYNPDTESLFGILDSDSDIYELDLDGNLIRTITLTGFNDTESIAYLGNNQFVVGEEQLGRLVFITVPPGNSNISISYPGSTEYIQMTGTWGGTGIEAVSYDFHNDILYFAKEKNNIDVFKIVDPVSQKGNSLAPIQAFDISVQLPSYPADPTFSNLNGFAYTFHGSLMMVSRSGNSLVEIDPLTGELLSHQDLTTAGINYAQGVAVIGNDEFIVIGEPNEFCYYKKSCSNIVDSSVEGSFGDVEERQNGSIYPNSSDIELVNDGNNNGDQTIGLEFLDLNIPSGSIINAAHIQFTSDNANSDIDPVTLTISADAIPNPPAISNTAFDLSTRTTTANSVSWSPPSWTQTLLAGPNQKTPDISGIIQELVNSAGANDLQSVIIIITGTGRRTAASYDQDPSYAASIHIDYDGDCIDADFDSICDNVDNCPTTTNPDQTDTNNDGIGDACEMPVVSNCNRFPVLSDNINRWVGPLSANWYDDECYWSQGSFPTSCDDVIIDMANATVTLRSGATAAGYTIEVQTQSTLDIELGAEICIEVY